MRQHPSFFLKLTSLQSKQRDLSNAYAFTPLSGTQKMALNRKRLRQAHVFTILLRISIIHSNRESSDVALVRSE